MFDEDSFIQQCTFGTLTPDWLLHYIQAGRSLSVKKLEDTRWSSLPCFLTFLCTVDSSKQFLPILRTLDGFQALATAHAHEALPLSALSNRPDLFKLFLNLLPPSRSLNSFALRLLRAVLTKSKSCFSLLFTETTDAQRTQLALGFHQASDGQLRHFDAASLQLLAAIFYGFQTGRTALKDSVIRRLRKNEPLQTLPALSKLVSAQISPELWEECLSNAAVRKLLSADVLTTTDQVERYFESLSASPTACRKSQTCR